MANYTSAHTGAEIDAAVLAAKDSGATDNLGRQMFSPNFTGPPRFGTRLRKTLQSIASGDRTNIRRMDIGDSLATVNWDTLGYRLEAILAEHFPSDDWAGFHDDAPIKSLGMYAILPTYSTASRFEKADYTLSWIGIYTEHTTGEHSRWGYGNGTKKCDRIVVPLVTTPGGGTVKIQVQETYLASATNWRSPIADEIVSSHTLTGSDLLVSTDAAAGLTLVELEFSTVEDRTILITHTAGGTVKCLDPCAQVTTAQAVNSWVIAAGSNDFANETDGATTNMGAVIANFDPDLIVIQSDDSTASYQNFLPKLAAAITASGRNPDVLILGNAGIGTGFGTTEAGLAERIAYCWEYATARRWDVLDGLALMGGIDVLLDNSWAPDQVHLNGNVYLAMAEYWAQDRGFMAVQRKSAGGTIATRANILASDGEKSITAQHALFLTSQFLPVDTGWMTWTANVTGTGAASKLQTKLSIDSGTTAGGAARLYLGAADIDIGYSTNNGRVDTGKPGAMSASLHVDSSSTNGKAYILLEGVSNTLGYVDGLTTYGFGWRLRDLTLDGIAWRGAQYATASSVTLTKGTGAKSYKLDMIWGAVSGNYRSVEFFVDGVSIGAIDYSHGTQHRALGVSVSNGADASRNRIYLRPPSLILSA